MWFAAECAGRFAREALSLGEGEVCAVFRRSFYLKFSSTEATRYACVGDGSLGKGPLNALVRDYATPGLGERVAVTLENATAWQPAAGEIVSHQGVNALRRAAARRAPQDGLGCLVVGAHNALSAHAQPALDAIGRWLAGADLGPEIEPLIGLGPGLTPSGDDYLGGMLVALRASGRATQANALWRWLRARLQRTSALSGAHLAAAAEGEAHEALHACLANLGRPNESWEQLLTALDAVGHCSGWDALAGALAVIDPR
jgi:hypothetical protein